jgi:hypothetical protein
MSTKKLFRSTLFSCGIVLTLSSASQLVAQTPILGGAKERQPSYGELENFTILSYTDLEGWDQAAEFRVSKDGRHAHVSNYQGFSIVDVSEPTKPRVIDPYHPKAVGHFVPPVFRRVNSDAGHADDVFVHENGLVFFSSSDPGAVFGSLATRPA